MAQYEHLQLVRLPVRMERRKHGGGGDPPVREPSQHSERIKTELIQAIETQKRRRWPTSVDPTLILRVKMAGASQEEEWNKVGLTLISSDEDRSLVLFASNEELQVFRDRLESYSEGVPDGQKAPHYNGFVANIDEISDVRPKDRIGIRAREEGFSDSADFLDDVSYVVDVELWDIGRRDFRERKLNEISAFVTEAGGAELDRYIGPSITMARFECGGAAVRNLLSAEVVSELDFLPQIEQTTQQLSPLTLQDLPQLGDAGPDAPIIGIIDSGVNDHPLLDDLIIGAIGIPAELGTNDDWGHGTKVAGIAVFGDLRTQLVAGQLQRGARICSAKVLDERGQFPNSRLTARQMREAITRLHDDFGCRIFVIALGDRKKIYDGGKVGVWAATLDELSRELDVVIVVSAGNRPPRTGDLIEEAVTQYPAYLTEAKNRLCEPAGAMNVITVGALAHGNGLAPVLAGHVGVLAITQAYEPAPFSRVGPGIDGAIKPDFVDLGGTLIYDSGVARLRGGEEVPEAGMMSLHNRFLDQLFTYVSGTSFSAPLVAFKASQVLTAFPAASANLIRALLVGSAQTPDAATSKIAHLGDDSARYICGHGQIDLEKAIFSDDARVVFYAEDELAVDHFVVFQVPVPDLFQTTKGRRHIRVSLAYDPPVKHSRRDYAGVSVGFRLIRGLTPEEIFEHYRSRIKTEGKAPKMPAVNDCSFDLGPVLREKSSLQTATASFSRDISHHGDVYYLVVRCSGGWSGDTGHQKFAVTVELAHEAEIQLYARVTQRVRVTA